MIDQELIFWVFMVAAIVAGGLWLIVIADLRRYMDLQKRLKAEREKGE